jgi:hypothetical protein
VVACALWQPAPDDFGMLDCFLVMYTAGFWVESDHDNQFQMYFWLTCHFGGVLLGTAAERERVVCDERAGIGKLPWAARCSFLVVGDEGVYVGPVARLRDGIDQLGMWWQAIWRSRAVLMHSSGLHYSAPF